MRSTRCLQVRKALKSLSWLTASEIGQLTDRLAISHHRRRCPIFPENSLSEPALILLAGLVRITCVNRKGRKTTVMLVGPGIIPAFPTPTSGVTCSFRYEAVTHCTVGIMELEAFVKICLKIESAPFKLLAISCIGPWEQVQLRCSNFMSFTLQERVALLLLDLSKNFGGPNLVGWVPLTIPVRQADLAEMVGASRPRVTEQLTEFVQEALICREGRHFLVNRDRLIDFLAMPHPAFNKTRKKAAVGALKVDLN